MTKDSSLRLYEKAMLLVLKDKEGVVGVSMYTYGIAGSLLAELFLMNRLSAQGKKAIVSVQDPTPIGDHLLDECLDLIKNSSRDRQAQYWISKLGSIKGLKERVARKLCQRGILREDEGKVLFFFTRKIYPEVNPKPERELISELHQAIFTDAPSITPETAALVSVGHSTGLLRANFDAKELKTRKDRIESIINGDVAGPASEAAVQAVQAAIFVCCIIPVITS